MDHWTLDGDLYKVVSFYSLPDDAWMYELTGPAGVSARTPTLMVIIPDATPDEGPFTPSSSSSVRVLTTDGTLPWPLVIRLMQFIETSGDITATTDGPTATGVLDLAHNTWAFADARYSVNSFYFIDQSCWCYEIFQSVPQLTQNDFIDVRIPDLAPDGGPFAASSADRWVMTSHGDCDIPWPVFRRFLNLIATENN